MTNPDAVAAQLRGWALRHGVGFRRASFEGLPMLAQVDAMLETDLLVSYHGSGVGTAHLWMPPRSVVVEISPTRWWACSFSYCGAASGKAWIFSAPAGAPPAGVAAPFSSLRPDVREPPLQWMKYGNPAAEGPVVGRAVSVSRLLLLLSLIVTRQSKQQQHDLDLHEAAVAAAVDLRSKIAWLGGGCNGTMLQLWESP